MGGLLHFLEQALPKMLVDKSCGYRVADAAVCCLLFLHPEENEETFPSRLKAEFARGLQAVHPTSLCTVQHNGKVCLELRIVCTMFQPLLCQRLDQVILVGVLRGCKSRGCKTEMLTIQLRLQSCAHFLNWVRLTSE